MKRPFVAFRRYRDEFGCLRLFHAPTLAATWSSPEEGWRPL